MGDMTGTTMANWLPTIESALANVSLRSNTLNANLLDRRWEAEIRGRAGDRVNIPHFSQNQASDAVARSPFGTGAGLTWGSPIEGQTVLIIDRLTYSAYRQPVEMTLQAQPVYQLHLGEGVGEAIALKEDSDIASDNTDGFDSFATVVGADAVDITEDDIITCGVNLSNNNAPLTDRFIPISPASLASVRKIESARNTLYGPNTGQLSAGRGRGFAGSYQGFDFFETNNLEAGSSGKKNAAFHRRAIAYAIQQDLRMVGDLNIEDGLFNQRVGYLVTGFKKIVDLLGNELDGK